MGNGARKWKKRVWNIQKGPNHTTTTTAEPTKLTKPPKSPPQQHKTKPTKVSKRAILKEMIDGCVGYFISCAEGAKGKEEKKTKFHRTYAEVQNEQTVRIIFKQTKQQTGNHANRKKSKEEKKQEQTTKPKEQTHK